MNKQVKLLKAKKKKTMSLICHNDKILYCIRKLHIWAMLLCIIILSC